MLFKESNQLMHVYNKQYAVGQGGLHLCNIIFENHNKKILSHFAYIYDCGTIYENIDILENQISTLVNDIKDYSRHYRYEYLYSRKLPTLERLYIFISHLHDDHINGLVYLKETLTQMGITKENTDIRLFFPYTSNIEKNIIIGSYEPCNGLSRDEYRRLITNPQDYFENFYDVYYVDDGNDYNFEYNENDIDDNSHCNNTHKGYGIPEPYKRNIYNHNQEFKIGNNDFWVLRMFYKKIDDETENLIRNSINIDFDEISDKTVESISKEYTTILGEKAQNRSSICLYSGPCSHIAGSGFLHTGDCELKTKTTLFSLEKHYQKYLNNIVVAQIPHHGSKGNSQLCTFNILDNLRLLYITKQEVTNGSQKPHINTEYNKSYVKQVTERRNSELSFANYHALDTILINTPTIKAQHKNEYNSYTGILKFEYIGDRTKAKDLYKHENSYITRAPNHPWQLTSDKELFMVFVDKDNKQEPYIVGRAKTHGFNKSNIIEDEDHYKYYVRLYDIDVVDGKFENGIPLYELIKKYKWSMFPGTKAKNPYYAYSQKSYRIISDAVKNEINKRLDEIGLVRLD